VAASQAQTVLVVEDEASIASFISLYLKNAGYRVKAVSSGGDALAQVEVEQPALIVLDGWGLAPPGPGNAVALAQTPVFDELWSRYPHTELSASGRAVGLPEREGLLVRWVEDGSPADRAGVQRGDLIVAAAGQPVADVDALYGALDAAGATLALTVVRGTEESELTVAFDGETAEV